MMERSQPSLMQLLAPTSTTALNVHENQGQVAAVAVFSGTPAAAAAERRVSTLSFSKAAAAATKAAKLNQKQSTTPLKRSRKSSAASPVVFRDASAPFSKHCSTPSAASNAFSGAGPTRFITDSTAAEEDEEEARPSDTTASSRATFSLVARRPTLMFSTGSSAAAGVHGGDGNPAAATAAAAAAAAFNRASGRASILAAHFGSSLTGDCPRSPRRSTASAKSDMTLDGEQETFPSPRPPPHPRRATLAGQVDFLEGDDTDSSTEVDHDDENAQLSDASETAAAPQRKATDRLLADKAEAGEPMLMSDYVANLFVSFDPALCTAVHQVPARVHSTAGSGYSSSQASSACPSPMSQPMRASIKMRSVTLAPISSACHTPPSAVGVDDEKRRYPQGIPRPSSQTWLTPAAAAATITAADDDVPRPSCVAFLPEGCLTNLPSTTCSRNATESPSSVDALPIMCGRNADADDADDEAEHLTDEVVGVTMDTEHTLCGQCETSLLSDHPNPLGRDRNRLSASSKNSNSNNCSGSVLSDGSLDASTSTQRQHLSVPSVYLADVTKEAAAHASAPPQTHQSTLLSPADAVSQNNHGGSEGWHCCPPSSLMPANEGVDREVDSSSLITAAVDLPLSAKSHVYAVAPNIVTRASSLSSLTDSKGENAVPFLSFDTLDQMPDERDTAARVPERAPTSTPPRRVHVAALWWAQRYFRATLGGAALVHLAAWQRVRRTMMWMSGIASNVARVLLRPFAQPVGSGKEVKTSHAAFTKTDTKANLSVMTGGAGFPPLRGTQDKPFSPPLSASRLSARKGANPVVGGSSFFERLQLSLPLYPSAPNSYGEQKKALRPSAPSSQVITDLQQTLRETWNGSADAWFATTAQQEPRTALRSGARLLRTQPSNHSFSSSQMQSSTGAFGGGGGGRDDDSVPQSLRTTAPSSPALSFAESFLTEHADAAHREPLLLIPGALATTDRSGSPSIDRHAYLPTQARGASYSGSLSAQSAILDDVYRAQLYHEFRHPPSSRIGDLSGCIAVYKAMVETSSIGQHVLNWKELSFLLMPEDYIDYRDLFPPYHFVSFPDFVEFVEVLSVRHHV